MATKILLKPSAYNQLLKVLNGQPQSSVLWRHCPRCFTNGHRRFQWTAFRRYDDGCSEGQRERTFAFIGRAVTNEKGILLRLQKDSSTGQHSKRWFSDSEVEEPEMKNVDVCASTAEDENTTLDSRNSHPAADGGKLSQPHERETALLDGEGSLSDNETILTKDAEYKVFVQESDKEQVGRLENSGQGTVLSNALARTDHEETETDLLDDQVKIDILTEQESPTVLEEFIQPLLPTESLSLAAYADHSPTLQRLVDLGVDLSKVEKKAKIGDALIKMDFDKHIKDKIMFLHRMGVKSGEGLGRFLTVNPFVLTEDLENLETRLRYLKSKNFSDDAITQVLTRAPYFISFSVERVDSKLGFYQKVLSLTGDEVRHIITRTPKLVTFKIQRVKENMFVLRQQLGFSASELKKLVLGDPRLLLRSKEKLIGIFDYMHNHMGIPHKQLLKNPQVFNGRVFKIQERHQFLKMLGRAQYDPTQPGYVAIECLTRLPDDVFCQEIAKSSMEEYNNFLKTL